MLEKQDVARKSYSITLFYYKSTGIPDLPIDSNQVDSHIFECDQFGALHPAVILITSTVVVKFWSLGLARWIGVESEGC